MTLASIIAAGILTYFTRMTMIALISRDMLGDKIKAVLEYEGPIKSPIKKGDKEGILNVYVSGDLNKQIDVFSAENIKKSNIFSRLFRSLNYLVWGDV